MNLVIALDLPSLEENLNLIKSLDFALDCPQTPPHKRKIWLKVGLRAFVRDGIAGIEAIKKACALPIFLDLKLYDIPNTMADAIEECAKIGINMLTIHASAGTRAMCEVMARLEKLDFAKNDSSQLCGDFSKISKPLIMAVSALTSFDEAEFSEVYRTDIAKAVSDFATISAKSRINGMVCSVQECALIKKSYPNLLTLTPAIRPNIGKQVAQESKNKHSNNAKHDNEKHNDKKNDDQRRVATLQEAYDAGADFVVIGRPIYRATSPQQALQEILSQMQNLC